MTNYYKRFVDLMPITPRQVGSVVSSGGLRTRVDLVGGGTRTYQGSARVGSMVYLEGDLIVGEAPSLPVVVIEV